jgi:hypothetical protein
MPSIVTTQGYQRLRPPGKNRMRYCVVDEYAGDTLSEEHAHFQTTAHPWANRRRSSMAHWSIFDVLEMNFSYGGWQPPLGSRWCSYSPPSTS